MKVLLISSSPHKEKSKTFFLAKEVLRALEQEGVDTEVIHLDDHRIFFCKHCEECHKKILHCRITDDVHIILKKMLECDGIILATPNYIYQVTASMKALFERSASFIHCKRLMGKYIAGVVSSGSGQDQDVLDYIKLYANACGAQYSGGVSSAAYSVEQKKDQAFESGRQLALDIKEKKAYPQQLELIEKGKQHFRKIVELRKKDWEEEYQYWQKMGWIV
ncbi:MAG: flavodoxin family protein [Candidatus Omnitrophota bacterium]|nr:flavodoxin family protein [Candidatus Omnitrophota bacterium]MBU1928817.1 flavodoxin family protein [Candidatus Omnitrophota bacterium]MBU2035505.1 flavodoxin family protein [Candidatus Omnitrophota bacterium]MBU2222131.1 flavodoxin family protein [Candidatus Omnitrophota bacterium]MBU2257654.1 flavodoxin family protein [Candidatus Omnitrophota bacterium]